MEMKIMEMKIMEMKIMQKIIVSRWKKRIEERTCNRPSLMNTYSTRNLSLSVAVR